MMQLNLDYGRGRKSITIADGRRISVLEPAKGEALHDPSGTIAAALRAPIGSKPLHELAQGRRSAAVVISDKTRPVPNGLTLPPILSTLEAAGVPRAGIEVIVATGLHRPNTDDELIEMTSRELVGAYRFRNHIARNAEEHAHLGRTQQGTEIWIDRGFVNAELKVVTGLIEPHLMAGFSGGRKAVAPGLAGVETMRRAHGAAMLEDHVGPGIIDGNPFHTDLMEIARSVGVDFMMDVTIDRRRRLTGVFAGDIAAAHAAGIAHVERHVRVDLDEPADIVLTSAGGYPLDDTFYQAIKGLTAALNIVRRGGTIILAAALSEGIGSADFCRLLDSVEDPQLFMQRLLQPGFFQIDQWMLQHLCQVLRKARVIVASDSPTGPALPRHLVRHTNSVEEALQLALADHPAPHIAVMPQGPYILPTVCGRKLSLGRAWCDDAA